MIICAAGHRPRNGLGNTSGVTAERGRNSRGNCLASSRPDPCRGDAPRELWFTTVVSGWFREKTASKFINMTQIYVYDTTLRHMIRVAPAKFQALLPYLAWISLPRITRLHKTRLRRCTMRPRFTKPRCVSRMCDCHPPRGWQMRARAVDGPQGRDWLVQPFASATSSPKRP